MLALLVLVVVRRRRPKGSGSVGSAIDLTLPAGDTAVVPGGDGAELGTVTIGREDGPTAVLVHCWMGDRSLWSPVANRLVDEGWRVVLYDQRGHGTSTPGTAVPAVEQLGEDLHHVLDVLELHDVVLVGHSMGGMAIQALLIGHPEDNDRLAGVVLASTSSRTFRRAIPARAADLVIGQRADRRLQRRSANSFRRVFGPDATDSQAQAVHDLVRATAPDVRSGYLAAMSRMDNRDRLAPVDVPVRIIVGDRDRLTPPAHSRLLSSAFGDAPLTVIEGKGHMLPIEAPEEIVQAVTSVHAANPTATTPHAVS